MCKNVFTTYTLEAHSCTMLTGAKMPLEEQSLYWIVHTLLYPLIDQQVFTFTASNVATKSVFSPQCHVTSYMLSSRITQLFLTVADQMTHVMLTRYFLPSLMILVSLDFMTTTRPLLRCSTKMWVKSTLQTLTYNGFSLFQYFSAFCAHVFLLLRHQNTIAVVKQDLSDKQRTSYM